MDHPVPERSRSFSDPAPPRFAAGKKLALSALETVFPAGAALRRHGAPEKYQFALPEQTDPWQ
jgi:hypothetical protein